MLVVVVPVILATLGFAWWYRAQQVERPRVTSSSRGKKSNIEHGMLEHRFFDELLGPFFPFFWL